MSKHTALPWKLSKAEEKKNFVQIPVEQGMAVVCYVVGSTNPMIDWYQGAAHVDANARLIVNAVNNYDRLREALKNAVFLMESNAERIEGEWGMGKSLKSMGKDGELPEELIDARALLAELDNLEKQQ